MGEIRKEPCLNCLELAAQEAISHFSLESVVPILHEQTIICSKTRLDGTTHEQTIICRQSFAGQVVGCRPMEGKKKLHQMIITIFCVSCNKLSAFYAQLYHLSSVRLRDLCSKLDVQEDLRVK